MGLSTSESLSGGSLLARSSVLASFSNLAQSRLPGKLTYPLVLPWLMPRSMVRDRLSPSSLEREFIVSTVFINPLYWGWSRMSYSWVRPSSTGNCRELAHMNSAGAAPFSEKSISTRRFFRSQSATPWMNLLALASLVNSNPLVSNLMLILPGLVASHVGNDIERSYFCISTSEMVPLSNTSRVLLSIVRKNSR